MRKMTRRLIFAIIILIYAIPSYGITFISGSEPIKSSDNYYWWIANYSGHQIKVVVWPSLNNYQDKLTENEIESNITILNNTERMIVTVNQHAFKKNQIIWLNIMEQGNKKIRLTRIRIQLMP